MEKSLAKVRWERNYKTDKNRRIEKSDWYDIERNTIDLRNMMSTDLPFNSRVYLPNALLESAEIELQMLKMKLNLTAEEYTESEDYKRNKNITKTQERGIKLLRERRDNQEIVIFQTDKTSKMAVDSSNNYTKTMEEEHVGQDPVITKKENRDTEDTLNAHAICWIRFLQAGSETGDEWRIKMSIKSHHNEPACLYSLRKDHKTQRNITENLGNGTQEVEIIVDEEVEEEVTNLRDGPPTRPVCDATEGISRRFSYLVSNLLQEVSYGPTVCNITEEMLASIEKLNDEGIEEEFVIGSADVKALYPSLDVEHVVDIVCQEFIQKKVRIKGIEYDELGLYLALNIEKEVLEQLGLKDVCPTRVTNLGRKPEVTECGVEVSKKKIFEPWNKARRIPTYREEEMMIREAMRIALLMILKNHTYKFNRKIRKQGKGVEVDLTGIVAKIYMKWWDRQLIGRLADIGINTNLYERYIDDTNMVLAKIEEGARYVCRGRNGSDR